MARFARNETGRCPSHYFQHHHHCCCSRFAAPWKAAAGRFGGRNCVTIPCLGQMSVMFLVALVACSLQDHEEEIWAEESSLVEVVRSLDLGAVSGARAIVRGKESGCCN